MNIIDRLDTTFLSSPMANVLNISPCLIIFTDSFDKSWTQIVEIYSHLFV